MKKVTLFNTKHQDILEKVYDGLYQDVIDLSDLEGINTICTYGTLQQIREKISTHKRSDIYFLGNGNFHYLTFPLTQQYTHPFTLIVFDHHNDAGSFPFAKITTCGSWINDAIEQNPVIKEVIVIGSTQQNEKELVETNLSKIRFLYEKEMTKERIEELAKTIQTEDIYLSIDRDILTEKQVQTNWDQGTITVDQLLQAICLVAKNHQVIGSDVCGDLEWDYTSSFRYPMKKYLQQTYQVNKLLFEELEEVMQ